jgi:multicomponent Na+:H+ antiporter subunit E
MNLFLLNLLLALAWAVVTGSFAMPNLAFGFALGFAALWLPRQLWGRSNYFVRVWRVAGLSLLFLYELVLSSLRVTRDVLRPTLRFQPGIVALPLDAAGDAEITLLANLITLTPGTMSVDVSADRRVLFIHAMDAAEPEALKRDIKAGFERRILEAFR